MNFWCCRAMRSIACDTVNFTFYKRHRLLRSIQSSIRNVPKHSHQLFTYLKPWTVCPPASFRHISFCPLISFSSSSTSLSFPPRNVQEHSHQLFPHLRSWMVCTLPGVLPYHPFIFFTLFPSQLFRNLAVTGGVLLIHLPLLSFFPYPLLILPSLPLLSLSLSPLPSLSFFLCFFLLSSFFLTLTSTPLPISNSISLYSSPSPHC
jgi:hypothetical protein